MLPDIVPAILSKTIQDFQADITKILNSKNLRNGWVHIDFMDNEFVPNQSIKPEDLENIDFGNLKREAHLMVKHPKEWIEKLIKLSFERIIIHFETDGDLKEYINLAKSGGAEVVIALKHETDLEELVPYAGLIDRVLLMGVVPGFQGQPFIPQVIDKTRELKAKNWPIKIEVDGAVRDTNAKQLLEAGVDCLIIGSFIIKDDPDIGLEKVHQALL
ncbi:ribulose-phosphate 3-epimerase [Candidatus Daviesbacteria bacterium]|nr:ribulose-phosphate 3-epimerase [Candidatus Daviesbacteria bacterium]